MLGERIRERRLIVHLSQAQLAKKLHVTQGAVSQWEKEITRPDFDILNALEDILNTNLSYLLGSSDNPQPRPSIDELSAEYEAEQERDLARWSLDDEKRKNSDRRLLFQLAKNGSDFDVRMLGALIRALQATNPQFYPEPK